MARSTHVPTGTNQQQREWTKKKRTGAHLSRTDRDNVGRTSEACTDCLSQHPIRRHIRHFRATRRERRQRQVRINAPIRRQQCQVHIDRQACVVSDSDRHGVVGRARQLRRFGLGRSSVARAGSDAPILARALRRHAAGARYQRRAPALTHLPGNNGVDFRGGSARFVPR